VAGVGSGKTRTIEELRRVLLTEEGVLPLAITYNNYWHLVGTELGWSKSGKMCFALTVVARMASMLYGKPLVDVLSVMEPYKASLTHGPNAGVRVIHDFVLHAVEQVNAIREGKNDKPKVTGVVLLVDETLVPVERMKDKFDTLFDVTQVLRDAILIYPILPESTGQSPPLKTALVISSLSPGPLGAREGGGRALEMVQLPAHLPAREIVQKWWGCDKWSETDQDHLTLPAGGHLCEPTPGRWMLGGCVSPFTLLSCSKALLQVTMSSLVHTTCACFPGGGICSPISA